MDRHLLGCVMLVSGSKAVGCASGARKFPIQYDVVYEHLQRVSSFRDRRAELERGSIRSLRKSIHSVVIFRRGRLMPACRSQYMPDMPVAPVFFPPGGPFSG
jgi:hypothetical protein